MLVLILSQLTMIYFFRFDFTNTSLWQREKYVPNWDYFPPEKDLETNDQHAQDGKKTALRQKKVLEKEIVECLEK